MKTEIKKTIAKLSAVALMLAMVVSVAPQSDAAETSENVQINAAVLATLNLAVDAATVNISVDPDVNNGTNMSGGVVSDSTTTEVSTNNFAGYKLQIKLAGAASTGSAVLDGQNTTDVITAGDFATENTFGFALNAANAATVDTFTSVNADIYELDNTTLSGLGTATNQDFETVYYYMNVDHTKAADTYQGTVTYTAMTL